MSTLHLSGRITTVAALALAVALPTIQASAAAAARKTAPTVSAVSPKLGPIAGGTKVTLHGTRFTGVQSVTVGNIATHKVKVLSASELTLVTPTHAAGQVDIRVRTTHGTSGTSAADHFGYVPAPTVSKVKLIKGNGLHGSIVRVSGQNLDGALAVHFGKTAGHIVADAAHKLDAKVPAHHAGRLHVTVKTAGGLSTAGRNDEYPMPQPVAQKWMQDTDLGSGKGELQAASCPTATTCYAVDVDQVWKVTDGVWGDPVTLPDEHGEAWAQRISCPTADFCAVAGIQYLYVLQGGTWTVGPHMGAGGEPIDVSCPAAGHCVATSPSEYSVLSDGTWSSTADTPTDIYGIDCYADMQCLAGGQAFGGDAVVYSFDGATWTKAMQTNADGPAGAPSCASSSLCAVLAGDEITVWNGDSWSNPTTLDPADPTIPGPGNLTCTSDTCVFDAGQSVYTSTGGDWSRTASSATYRLITCATPTSCIGEDNLGHIANYDGSGWDQTTTQLAEVGPASSMDCPSATFCAMTDENGNAYTFDGTDWSDPNRITDTFYKPAAVSCVGSNFCLAVFGDSSTARWNGTHWVNAAGPAASETAVSCASTTMCVAVGPQDSEIFDGHAWTVGDSGTKRLAVSCGSTSFCVGVSDDEVQTFDGAHWHDAVSDDNLWNVDAHAVSCPSADFCLVVDGEGRQIAYQDNGWSDPLPTLAVGPMTISCYSDTFCQVHGMGYSQSFDGHYWSAIDRSGALNEVDDLSALSCYGALTCRAASMTRIYSSQPG